MWTSRRREVSKERLLVNAAQPRPTIEHIEAEEPRKRRFNHLNARHDRATRRRNIIVLRATTRL